MTLPQPQLENGKFHCNPCNITFSGEYKKQKRPRKSCPGCHKMADIARSRDPSIITDKETQGEGSNGASPLTKYTKVDDEMIEESILYLANHGKIDVPLIGKMIEFYYKIRGKDDSIRDNIPMEEFMKLGESIKSSN